STFDKNRRQTRGVHGMSSLTDGTRFGLGKGYVTQRRTWEFAAIGICLFICASTFAAPVRAAVDAEALAKSATIHRDDYGTPHIEGPTDESVVFAFAYAQAEDYFWQLEDNYILALGRYS